MIPQGRLEEFCGELEMRRTICGSHDGNLQLASILGSLWHMAKDGRKAGGDSEARAAGRVNRGCRRGRVEWVVRMHAPMKEADVVAAAMAPNDGHVSARDDDGSVRADVESGVERLVKEKRLARSGGTLVHGPKWKE